MKLLEGDCIAVMKTLPARSVDTILTDPPYGLEFMGSEWDGSDGFRRSLNEADAGRENVFGRTSRTSPEYRTGLRTDWENRSGFTSPGIGERKTAWPSFTTGPNGNANPTCARCGGRQRGKKKCRCETPEWKPIGKRRNPENENLPADATSSGLAAQMSLFQQWTTAWATEALRVAKPGAFMLVFGGTRTFHRMACGLEDAGWFVRDCISWLYGQGFPKSHNFGRNIPDWEGWGTALKPSWEPIIVAMKPLDGTFADNAAKHGVAGLNIDGGRIPVTDDSYAKNCAGDRGHADNRTRQSGFKLGCGTASEGGRWPANVMLDDTASTQLDEQSGPSSVTGRRTDASRNAVVAGTSWGTDNHKSTEYTNESDRRVSRFFYCAKASTSERGQHNTHPTVKPLALMRYLCTLTATPTGGVLMDPFLGSGTTALACQELGRDFIGIERNPAYLAIARERLRQAQPEPRLFG